MNQLSLTYTDKWLAHEKWLRVLEVAELVIGELTLKQCAFDLNTSPGSISNALKQRDRHAFHAHWLIYLVAHDKTGRLAAAIADAGNLDVVPRRELTPAERLERIEGALAELSPDIRDLIHRKAGLKP